ncbi:MAG: hypothetical protein IJU31_02130 [Synergistaceae bacterium]|nr:hypothetical protein [Synergistaceae bacterium]
MKKIFLAMLMMLMAFSANASTYTDTVIPGKWNIYGTSFVEKNFVRVSFKLEGEMNQATEFLKNISADIDKIIEDNQEKTRNVINPDRKVLNECAINLRIYALDKSGFDIRVWKGEISNAVEIPVLLPEMNPTIGKPFVLPSVTYEGLTLTVTFTSEKAGKLRVQGYVDVDSVGSCEINADCTIWKDGTQMPSTEEETKSGCNAGTGIFSLIALLILGRSFRFCSGRI